MANKILISLEPPHLSASENSSREFTFQLCQLTVPPRLLPKKLFIQLRRELRTSDMNHRWVAPKRKGKDRQIQP